MLDIAEFLYPRDLQARPIEFRRVLLIGSCMAESILRALMPRCPNTHFDYIVFNNLSEMRNEPPAPISEYDFQFIQLPLRSLIGDQVIRFSSFLKPEMNREFFRNAHYALQLMLDQTLKYNKESKIITFVQNFVVPQLSPAASLYSMGTNFDLRNLIQSLNAKLVEIIAKYSNVYLIDAEAIGSSMGKRYFLDDWLGFFTHAGVWYPDWAELDPDRIEPVPPLEETSGNQINQFLEAIWRACEYNYRVIQQIDSVKLVIFDLDDTLWRGLIGEHYGEGVERPIWEGWPLGLHEAILHLKARGILVAICSKNSPEIVKERWERTIPLQWIKLDDFVAADIAWTPKAEGVGRLMSSLSLTPRSVLFVDDNPVERESVKDAFPGIRAIGGNPLATRRILLAAPETQVRVMTRESVARDEMMRRQIKRESVRKSMSREDFLANLQCRISLGRFDSPTDARFARAFELLNKTNQFNTDGKRWTVQELDKFFAEKGEIITFNVVDKFTDYGLVGVILLQSTTIAQFVMSCRVLGLDVEIGVLRSIVSTIRGGGDSDPIAAAIVETEANLPSRDVYERAGFKDLGAGRFAFENAQPMEIPSYLSIEWA